MLPLWQRDFADEMKDIEMGKVSGIIQVDSKYHKKCPPKKKAEEESTTEEEKAV